MQSISTSLDIVQTKLADVTNGLAVPEVLVSATDHAITGLKKKPSSELSSCIARKKRARKVRFQDPTPTTLLDPMHETQLPSVTGMGLDLCKTNSVCRYLRLHDTMSSTDLRCIGFLESPLMYKHLFYVREGALVRAPTGNGSNSTIVYSIFDIMKYDASEAVEVPEQLKLAHKTALAMLQYHNTPWLSERWRLQDVKYVGSKDTLDDTALRTLHLNSGISPQARINSDGCKMNGIQQTEDTVSDEDRFGINNVTLFFLGIALLEIAHWKPIEDQMVTRDLNNQIFAARRLRSKPTALGPVYQQLINMCLECNFGFGTKLSNKSLQTAVYNNVVCELETMMKTLNI